MGDKWNQWRQQELRNKTDDAQLHAIIGYLTHTHKIPRDRIKKDWYLLFHRATGQLILATETVTTEQFASLKPFVRHPDITIFSGSGKVQYIIELDGSIHKIKTHKTAKRNRDYETAGIPCIVIDIEDLSELGITWFDYLDEQIPKLNIK